MLPSSDIQPNVIPIIEEGLEIRRQTEEVGAVRVRVESSTRAEVVDTSLTERGVSFERIARNIPVAEVLEPWREGDVLVVPIYREVLVKQLMLIEEVRMTPTIQVKPESTLVELKTEMPVFERRDANGDWSSIPASDV